MDHNCNKPSNKRKDIVRLHQLLKKWMRLTVAPRTNTSSNSASKFLKKTLSFSETTSLSTIVPKGCFAVCVGDQMKLFVVPTECLSHAAFVDLLKVAKEFGFKQEGALRIPCDVSVFERVLQVMMKKRNGFGSLHYRLVEADGTRATISFRNLSR